MRKYSGITGTAQVRGTLRWSCVPSNVLCDDVPHNDEFLKQRSARKARKIQTYVGVR